MHEVNFPYHEKELNAAVIMLFPFDNTRHIRHALGILSKWQKCAVFRKKTSALAPTQGAQNFARAEKPILHPLVFPNISSKKR